MFTKFFKTFQVDEVPVLVRTEDLEPGLCQLTREIYHSEMGMLSLLTEGTPEAVRKMFDAFDQAEAEEFVSKHVRPVTASALEAQAQLADLPENLEVPLTNALTDADGDDLLEAIQGRGNGDGEHVDRLTGASTHRDGLL